MDSDVPKKQSGLFNAFKLSVAKTKYVTEQKVNDTSNSEEITGKIKVITRTGDVIGFDAEKISVAIGKAFLAIEGNERHSSILVDRISRQVIISQEFIDKEINSYFRSELFSIEGALKLTLASQAISILKKLKEITLSVIFTTTRNFSIQKNLSISA